MELSTVIKNHPSLERLVIKGIDNRIKLIYNKEEIPLELKLKQVYNAYLRSDGDLDVIMRI